MTDETPEAEYMAGIEAAVDELHVERARDAGEALAKGLVRPEDVASEIAVGRLAERRIAERRAQPHAVYPDFRSATDRRRGG